MKSPRLTRESRDLPPSQPSAIRKNRAFILISRHWDCRGLSSIRCGCTPNVRADGIAQASLSRAPRPRVWLKPSGLQVSALRSAVEKALQKRSAAAFELGTSSADVEGQTLTRGPREKTGAVMHIDFINYHHVHHLCRQNPILWSHCSHSSRNRSSAAQPEPPLMRSFSAADLSGTSKDPAAKNFRGNTTNNAQKADQIATYIALYFTQLSTLSAMCGSLRRAS